MISDRNIARRRHTQYIPALAFAGVGLVTGTAAANTYSGSGATLTTTMSALTLSAGTAPTYSGSGATLATVMSALTLTEGAPNTYDGASSTLATTMSALTLTAGGAPTYGGSLSTLATTMSALTLTTGALTISAKTMSSSAAAIEEAGSLAYGGILFDANGEYVRHLIPVPDYIDWSNDVYFRIRWSSASTTAADTVLFKLWYKTMGINTAVSSGALSGTAVALDTVIATDTKANTTADVVQVTPYGKLNRNTIIPSSTVDYLAIDVECDTLTGMASALFLGLEILYAPKYSSDNEKHQLLEPAPTDL